MAMTIEDSFRGDDAKLISCIESLITLNDAGALMPHGIGGHARTLLSSAAARLQTHITQPAQAVDVVAWRWRDNVRPGLPWKTTTDAEVIAQMQASGGYEIEPLTRALAGEKAEGWIPTDEDVRAWKGRNDVTLSLYDCRTAIEDARMMHHFDVSPTPPTDGEE